ncbi:MAG: hypothetical protein HS115_07095 [Spirochaetales bacterium]|nr:hypothetical protein [Spirochaetales bacterium]
MKSRKSRTLFLVWKANLTGEHIPVGRLDHQPGKTTFRYVQGVHKAILKGMGQIPEFADVGQTYDTADLFPFFQNRLMDPGRPDFAEYIESLGLDVHDSVALPFEVLERSEGRKVTDRFRIFRKPAEVKGYFQIHCFVSSMSRTPVFEHLDEVVEKLSEGDRLYPLLDVQNRFDKHAIALKKENDWTVGYVPAHYSSELQPLLKKDAESIQFIVVRINRPARAWLPDVVLMSMRGKFPVGWRPFEDGDYALVADAAALKYAVG